MKQLIEEKKQLKKELLKYQKIILEIENQIMNIEREIADFSEIEILDTLVLSDQQKAIVESDKKNILVIACPGSGKTHTVISRYVHLVVRKKINPNKAVISGIDARQINVTATVVCVIDQIKLIIALAKPIDPTTPDKPIFK